MAKEISLSNKTPQEITMEYEFSQISNTLKKKSPWWRHPLVRIALWFAGRNNRVATKTRERVVIENRKRKHSS